MTRPMSLVVTTRRPYSSLAAERVHQLAREAARRTGQTQTGVIEEALAMLLDELDRTDEPVRRAADVKRILEDVDRRLSDSDRARLNTDDLYDERGLSA